MPQTKAAQEAAAKEAKEKQLKKVSDVFAEQASPMNWQSDAHPAYQGDDLPEGLSKFVRDRYRHWAPKVVWVVRLWASLGILSNLFSEPWLTRTSDNTDADVRQDRRQRGRQVFFAGVCHTPTPDLY